MPSPRIHVSRSIFGSLMIQVFYRIGGIRVRELLIDGNHAETAICIGRKCVSTNHRYVCID